MEHATRQILSNIITAFETYALGDIKRIQKKGMPIAAVILCVCFIDQVSGFIYDCTIKGQKDNSARSRKFVVEYLNKVSIKPYNEKELIDLLRHKLVHNYSLSDKRMPKHKRYVLDFENPVLHLHSEEDIVVINVERFINDLEKAFDLYKVQLLNDTNVQKTAIKHYEVYGILVAKSVHLKNVELNNTEEKV